MNRTKTSSGLNSTCVARQASSAAIHSRTPAAVDRPCAGRARSASVIGPPSTSSSGPSMFSAMCSTMCRLKTALE